MRRKAKRPSESTVNLISREKSKSSLHNEVQELLITSQQLITLSLFEGGRGVSSLKYSELLSLLSMLIQMAHSHSPSRTFFVVVLEGILFFKFLTQ